MFKSTSFRKILVAIIFVFVCFVVIKIYQSAIYSARVKINAVPLESHITINDSSANEGVNRVRPGSQKVTVSLSGFTTLSKTINVQKGSSGTVTLVLTSDSSQTSNWYFTHPADEKEAEELSSQANDALVKQDLKNDPLIKLLPFVGGGLEFRVDYGTLPGSSSNVPEIYITAPTIQQQQDGVAWIKSLGYNPAKYAIKFVTGPVQPLNSD